MVAAAILATRFARLVRAEMLTKLSGEIPRNLEGRQVGREKDQLRFVRKDFRALPKATPQRAKQEKDG